MGRRLQAAATAPVELWEAPNAGHSELGPAAVEAASAFVRRQLR
jgi:hypothetical protein